MKKRPIAVIDDDPSVRDGLRALLEAQGHAVLLFENPDAFRARAAPEDFDCLLLDLWFPAGGNGIELLRDLIASGAATPVIMMTDHADVESAFRAGELGAVSYLPKPIRGLRLAEALDRARKQGRPAPPLPAAAIRRKLDSLTPMERKVLNRLALDRPNQRIAAEFGISVRTVETHRARVIEKLGTRSKIEMREFLAAVGELPAPGSP